MQICPIMSKPVVTSFNDECPDVMTAETVFVECQEDKCQLWGTVYTTERTRISGCSLEMAAHKNQDGLYAV